MFFCSLYVSIRLVITFLLIFNVFLLQNILSYCIRSESQHFMFLKIGVVKNGKESTWRKGAGTEKDCHGREDPNLAKDEKRTGIWLIYTLNSLKHIKHNSVLAVIGTLSNADNMSFICFLFSISGEARATSKTEERGGGDTEAARETEGDRTESSTKIQRLATEEKPEKNWNGKEGEGSVDICMRLM